MSSVEEQTQYKVQLLLHVNSLLLQRAMRPDVSAASFLKRIHANLQCISQLNQGNPAARPMILDPPPEAPQDILAKLYLLMARVFEIWSV
ncbi:Transcription regulatory protein SNF11 [Nakaseomyces bracarensis]|uniref:Transcription regulatory protein SNF11 n=1 Tax=Nakaseomyces bracarensis TaxID=273131 RepID=A0ABR4NXS9_9SACH